MSKSKNKNNEIVNAQSVDEFVNEELTKDCQEDNTTMVTPYGVRRVVGKKFSDVQNEYGYYYDENAKKRVFGVVGQKNIYEDILSHKDATDIRYIKEVLLNGGAPELTDEMFGDISNISSDLLVNLQKAELGRDMFNNLPIELRQKYGNDIYKFALEFKKEDFEEYVKNKFPQNKVLEKPKQEEKKENENI